MTHRRLFALLLTLAVLAPDTQARACTPNGPDVSLLRAYISLLEQYGTAPAGDTARQILKDMREVAHTNPSLSATQAALAALAEQAILAERAPPLSKDIRKAHTLMQRAMALKLADLGCLAGGGGAIYAGGSPQKLPTPADPGKAQKIGAATSPLAPGSALSASLDVLAERFSKRPILWLALTALASAILTAAWIGARRLFRKVIPRHFARYVLGADISVTFEGETTSTILRALDISQGGLKLAHKEDPAPGTKVVVQLNGQNLPGAVVWSNPHFTGARFDKPLSADQMQVFLAQSSLAGFQTEKKTAPDPGAANSSV